MAVRIYKDTLSPSLTDTITVNGAAVDLTGSTVRFRMRPIGAATLTVDEAAVLVTPAAGTVRYDWQAADVDTAGEYLGWWSTTLPNGDEQDSSEFLVIVAAHEPGARLCSLAEVKAADPAGLGNVGGDLDDVIEQYITDASEAIIRWTGRRYAPFDAAPSARVFDLAKVGRDGVVWVTDLGANPTLIRLLDEDATTVVQTVAASGYRVEPLVREQGEPITRIRLLDQARPAGGLLEVTGRWGWPAVPRRAARACVVTVVSWLRDARALTPQSPEQFEPGSPPMRMLPMAARDLVMMDRRMGVA